MTTLTLENEPLVAEVAIISGKLMVDLIDGRTIIVPLAWYPRLWHGSLRERQNWQLLGDGYAIEWPDLDEHIGVDGLLAGHKSSESQISLDKWLAARQAILSDLVIR